MSFFLWLDLTEGDWSSKSSFFYLLFNILIYINLIEILDFYYKTSLIFCFSCLQSVNGRQLPFGRGVNVIKNSNTRIFTAQLKYSFLNIQAIHLLLPKRFRSTLKCKRKGKNIKKQANKQTKLKTCPKQLQMRNSRSFVYVQSLVQHFGFSQLFISHWTAFPDTAGTSFMMS